MKRTIFFKILIITTLFTGLSGMENTQETIEIKTNEIEKPCLEKKTESFNNNKKLPDQTDYFQSNPFLICYCCIMGDLAPKADARVKGKL